MDYKNKRIDPNFDLVPVILSGGSGSRLWPLSRESFPKQYLNLDEKNKLSLLQNTYLRLQGLKNLKEPIIVSNKEQRFIVAEQMRAINVKPQSILLEPFAKNTAPAVALAALKALKNNDDPTLLILSSDHKIEDEENFRQVIGDALVEALNGRLVVFGIKPEGPETGYGYIRSYKVLSKKNQRSKIKNFVEKPNLELARKLIQNKHYFWNSGVFLFKAKTFLDELEKFEPEILNSCNEALTKGIMDLDFLRVNEEAFKKCPNKPIDIAVMEKTNLGSVFSLTAGWDDIGSWKSVWKNSKKNEDGNSLKGKTIVEDCKNCYLRSEGRLIVGINLNNLIIVETKDAILVANKDSAQEIKKIVNVLNNNNYKEGKHNKKSYRPWGSFTSIEEGDTWQVKKLELNPDASISLQKHQKRSEHWIIVNGKAKVEIENKISFVNQNESVYIPLGSKHRLSNPFKTPLILIEVQSGSYLGEDDIIRFEDIYGRSSQ